MKNTIGDIFLKNLPTLDLHGETRVTTNIMVNDFIKENHALNNKKLVVIHGMGMGIVKDETHNVMKKSKLVKSYNLSMYNSGCTIINLK